MKWNNLKNGQCPKCGKMMKQSGLGHGNIPALRCPDESCDFKISESRLKEILSSMPRSRDKTDDERHAEWNNLGTEDDTWEGAGPGKGEGGDWSNQD